MNVWSHQWKFLDNPDIVVVPKSRAFDDSSLRSVQRRLFFLSTSRCWWSSVSTVRALLEFVRAEAEAEAEFEELECVLQSGSTQYQKTISMWKINDQASRTTITHLKMKNDSPDQSERQLRITIGEFFRTNIHQTNLNQLDSIERSTDERRILTLWSCSRMCKHCSIFCKAWNFDEPLSRG